MGKSRTKRAGMFPLEAADAPGGDGADRNADQNIGDSSCPAPGAPGRVRAQEIRAAKILGAAAWGILILLSGCRELKKPGDIEADRFLLDTLVSIRIYDSKDQSLLDDAFDAIARYESELVRYKPGSLTARINASGGDSPVEVSENTLELLGTALRFAEISRGRFDPTVGALVDLWGIGGENPRVPDEPEIQAALASVGYEDVAVDTENRTVRLNRPGALLDLGAVTKGWIADAVIENLAESGARHVLINLGGNVRVIGGKPGGKPYRIGMQDPFSERGRYLGVFTLTEGSVISSGVYERFFEYEGRRYHHILDTRTGRPVENGLAAVTVISRRAADGDALSTALFALGLDEGMKTAAGMEGVEAVFITHEGALVLSPGARDIFEPSDADLNLRVYGE